MSQDMQKKQAAVKAIEYIEDDAIVGVGTGSTVNYFIDALADVKHKIEATVASSEASKQRLRALNIPVVDANSVSSIDVYIDGADEINQGLQMIKGGGGALTGEKILVSMAQKVICIADSSKQVHQLGSFPLPVEVIPMARSVVARALVRLGGDPSYRQGFVSDYGNIILDVHNLTIEKPIEMEQNINQIVGVVSNGLFAARAADVLLLGHDDKVEVITANC